jgi:hypothetical protein
VAYPFAPALTVAAFGARLVSDHGCSFVLRDFGGCKLFVARRVTGDGATSAVVGAHPDEMITPSVLRSVCARLHVDPSAFGFTLG